VMLSQPRGSQFFLHLPPLFFSFPCIHMDNPSYPHPSL
jgi:hypothetical protein